jgi:hypothetical protein
MGRHTVAAWVVLLLLGTPALARSLQVEIDEQADFDTFETFGWEPSEEDLRDTDEALHREMISLLRQRFSASGLRFVESDPDLWMTYQCAEKEEVWVYNKQIGPAIRGGRTVEEKRTVRVGTLIVEMRDNKTDVVVWRATGGSVLSRTAETNMKKAGKIINKMGKRWDRRR